MSKQRLIDTESTVYESEIQDYLADKETPYADALDGWLESDEGRDCQNILTLESAQSQRDMERFVLHRLERAYAAGWDRCHEQCAAIIKEHVTPQAE